MSKNQHKNQIFPIQFWSVLAILIATIFLLPPYPLFSQDVRKKNLDELLALSLEELMNVEITTAGKKPEKIKNIPASVIQVTREDIEKYGYQSLEEIIENIPGLYYNTDYISGNIGVRGFWSDDGAKCVLIMVNGVVQTEYLADKNLFELINVPIEAIDRIEVVRGPMSVMYGPGAFFGAINIFTNNVEKEQPANLVSASIGSEETKKAAMRLSGISNDNEFQYSLATSYSKTRGIDVPYAELGTIGHNVATTDGQLGNDIRSFIFSGLFKGLSVKSSYSERTQHSLMLAPSFSPEGNRINWRKMNFDIGYEKKFSDKFKAEIKFGYFYNTWNFIYDNIGYSNYGRQHNQSTGYRAEMNLFWDISPKLNITSGLSYLNIPDIICEYTVPSFNLNLYHHTLADGESKIDQAFFTQIDFALSDVFKIVAGVRLEQVPKYRLQKLVGDFETYTESISYLNYSNTKPEFIPRLAMIYQPNENHAIKLLYGKAINHPSFFQNTQNYVDGFFPKNLLPEYIQTLEMNYIMVPVKNVLINMSLFHNALNNLIYRTFSQSQGHVISYFENTGKMVTNGMELSIRSTPTEDINVELSFTYQNTKDKRIGFGNIKPGYSPDFLGYLKASYFFNKDISLALTGNYVSRVEPYYDPTLNPPARIGETVEGFILIGTNFRMRDLFGTNLYLNLRCSNLFDSEIRYPTTSNNSGFIPKGTIGHGRTFLVTVGYKF